MKSERAPARAVDFPCFDGLRTVAVIAAMLQHVGFVSGGFNDRYGWAVAHLEVGPAIFFMISAFLLYRPYAVANFGGRAAIPVRRFLRRRALRIFPAYWLALAIILTPLFGLDYSNPGEVLSFFTLTNIYSEEWFFHGITQSWTLAVEITFYAFLPAYALLMRRAGIGRDPGTRLRIELVGAVTMYATSLAWRELVFRDVLPHVADHWLPAYLDVFGVGIAVAALHTWTATTGREFTPVRWIAGHADVCALLAVASYLAVPALTSIDHYSVRVTGGEAFVRNAFHGLVALSLLLPAAFGDQQRSALRRLLRWGPVHYVGVVSYGVYLWHNAWLLHALDWTGGEVFDGNFVALFVLTLTLSTAAASVSYYVVEQAFLRLKDRPLREVLQRRRGSVEPAR